MEPGVLAKLTLTSPVPDWAVPFNSLLNDLSTVESATLSLTSVGPGIVRLHIQQGDCAYKLSRTDWRDLIHHYGAPFFFISVVEEPAFWRTNGPVTHSIPGFHCQLTRR